MMFYTWLVEHEDKKVQDPSVSATVKDSVCVGGNQSAIDVIQECPKIRA